MKLTRMRIEGLFGTFNHDIDLNSNPEITLILGRNGLGKTILLRMISALFGGHLDFLCQVNFKCFVLYFELGNKLTITREPKKYYELKFEFSTYKGRIVSTDSRALGIEQNSYNKFHEFLFKSKSDKDLYVHTLQESTDFDVKFDLINKLSNSWIKSAEKSKYEKYPNWLKEVISSYKGKLISTERIVVPSFSEKNDSDKLFKRTIVECSKDIVSQVSDALTKASELSADLDRTFPNRIVHVFEEKETLTPQMLDNLVGSLKLLRDKQNLLLEAGILKEPNTDLPMDIHKLNSHIYKILSVYVQDSLEKLKPYESLAYKLKLFLKILNSKMLLKEVRFVQFVGFEVYSTKTNDKISLQDLSSGEQHLFVLFYQMLFKHGKDTLLLIDEPEISLHVGWQKHFVDDLLEVLKLSPMTVIMATHSPTLIGSYWNLTSELRYEE